MTDQPADTAARTIHPPWTAEQVAALNEFQTAGLMHPFTCGGEHDHSADLVATPDGWTCPERCGYEQTWAHSFMAERRPG